MLIDLWQEPQQGKKGAQATHARFVDVKRRSPSISRSRSAADAAKHDVGWFPVPGVRAYPETHRRALVCPRFWNMFASTVFLRHDFVELEIRVLRSGLKLTRSAGCMKQTEILDVVQRMFLLSGCGGLSACAKRACTVLLDVVRNGY